jgi:hypothetical protein
MTIEYWSQRTNSIKVSSEVVYLTYCAIRDVVKCMRVCVVSMNINELIISTYRFTKKLYNLLYIVTFFILQKIKYYTQITIHIKFSKKKNYNYFYEIFIKNVLLHLKIMHKKAQHGTRLSGSNARSN